MNKKILIVEDEETLCEALKFNLEIEGYDVYVAYSAEEALKLDLARYDLMLLDVMMGQISGFKMAQMLKKDPKTASIPIIFCTAKGEEDDMVAGLNLGADDYITKPYTIRNVLARVRSVLRRSSVLGSCNEAKELRYNELRIDLEAKQCFIHDKPIALTKKELEILILLLKNPEQVFSREEILRRVWENDVVVGGRTVDVNITRLRQKLGTYGKNIITRSGYGYGFKI